MVGELITLPLRLTGTAARLWWRAADQAVSLGSSVAGAVLERVSPRDSAEPMAAPTARRESVPSRSPASSRTRTTAADRSQPVEPPVSSREDPLRTVPPVAEPGHVSEEPTLVEEVA